MIPETKRCSRCLVEKPASEFYVQRRGEREYLLSYCKPCKRRWAREHHERTRDPKTPRRHQRLNAKGEVWCNRCKAYLPASSFKRHPSRPHTFWAYCKPCTTVIDRERRWRKFSDDARWEEEKRRTVARDRRKARRRDADRRKFVADGIVLLRKRGFTKGEVVRILGTSWNSLLDWERQVRTPQPQVAERVVAALVLTSEFSNGEPPPLRSRRRGHPELPRLLAEMEPVWQTNPLRTKWGKA